MEMEQSRVGGGKVVTFEEAMIGRRRNGSLSTHREIGRDLDAGRVARPLQPQGAVSRRRTYADGELDVFAAERYFKGAMDGVHGKADDGVAAVVPPPAPPETAAAASARPAQAVAAGKPAGTRASSAVASVSASSAASANSQTVLLRRRRGHRGRKCCVQVSGVLMRTCSGKRSVRVDSGAAAKGKGVPVAGEPAASKIDWYRELRMQNASLGVAGDGGNHGVVAAGHLPPNLNHLGTAKVAAIGREVNREGKAAEFTCSSSRRRSFTLVAPVRSANAPASGRVGVGDAGGGGGNGHEDDDDGAGSESSSDLFEIKSLMIGDCPYEPSEASIQWSVATASAADASERVSARWIGHGGGRGQVAAGRQQHRDRPAGLLSGCVSHRAVAVSGSAARNAPPAVATRRRDDGFQKARDRA